MTQGAIDHVQAELSPPADLSLLLLKDTPYQQPQLIAVGCHEPTAPEHKTISNYTWWDSGDFICVSVPTEALLSGSASHLQCCIKEMQIQCTIEVAFAGAQPTHHRLAVPYLHAAVQPEQSSCFLNGSSLQASTVSTAQASSMLYCHTDSSTLTHVHCLDKPCSPGLTSPSHQPCSSASTDIHASQHAAQGKQQSLQAGFPAAESSGSMVLAQKSKNPCLLLKLRKSDPNNTWCTLAGQAPAKNSIKQVPPSPESMAALRRALIQQRQQKQARGVSACSASAATSWPVRPIGCVHLPQDTQAASCPSESGTMSQSESVQMTPVTAADGMLTSPGDEAVLLQHHTFNFEVGCQIFSSQRARQCCSIASQQDCIYVNSIYRRAKTLVKCAMDNLGKISHCWQSVFIGTSLDAAGPEIRSRGRGQAWSLSRCRTLLHSNAAKAGHCLKYREGTHPLLLGRLPDADRPAETGKTLRTSHTSPLQCYSVFSRSLLQLQMAAMLSTCVQHMTA